LVRSARHFAHKDYAQTVAAIEQARQLLDKDEYPSPTSLYSAIWINSQMALPRRQRSATAKGYAFFKENIAKLAQIDPELAKEVKSCKWPDDFLLIDFWSGLHFFCASKNALGFINESIVNDFSDSIKSRFPIGFGGIITGHELWYCLENRFDGLHGMSRAHYLFEPDPQQIKLLLHMFDLSEFLQTEELIIFGGSNMQKVCEERFDTLLYSHPIMVAGKTELVKQYMDQHDDRLDTLVQKDRVRDYYASDEFLARQKLIAKGEIQPRILISTCRWTTFLKYCAADFQNAFDQLGCETRYLIEKNDVQSLLTLHKWKQLGEFKPDVVFMVSFARPSMAYAPKELPFIGYIQDKCGPILTLPDFGQHITNQDLFVCMFNEFERYLTKKSVPAEQIFTMPIPADENMFYPLDSDHPNAEKFTVDVGFVKHGSAETEKLFENFLAEAFGDNIERNTKNKLVEIFTKLFESTCLNVEQCWYEDTMQDYVQSYLAAGAGDQERNYLGQLVASFYITVYSAAWRFQFLEALDKAAIELALYGNGWSDHSRLKHLNKGPIDRQTELNYVYNFNRINLSINHSASMHQRLSECGLAGGFMMVADHAQDKDWEPARQYYEEDKEVVFFDSQKDVVDKCRYYLEHENERLEIAENMHRRATRERTCAIGSQTILSKWRELLSASYEKK